jgi:hypothetical protein
MAGITINRVGGGLGRQQPGKDYYSGIIFQQASLPAGFAADDRIKLVTTLKEAEDLGITQALFPVEHYHISEFFKMAELVQGLAQGVLYVGIYNIGTGTYAGTQIQLVQDYANGEIRQMGVFLTDTFATSLVTDTQTVCATLETVNKPLSVLLAADFTGTTLSALSDLRALSAKKVSVVIGEDKGGVGGALATSEGNSITSLGATLGIAAVAAVHQSIGWRGRFNMLHGTEYETLQFATGEAWQTQSQATLTTLTTKGYIYLTKEVGFVGTFHSDSPTSVAATSDFAYLENNRTIDKAARLIRENNLPNIQAPLYVDADTGKLSESTIADFRAKAFKALDNMAANGEISTNAAGEVPANSVVINPDQNVLTTSKVIMTVKIVPVGVARDIEVNLGFAISIA